MLFHPSPWPCFWPRALFVMSLVVSSAAQAAADAFDLGGDVDFAPPAVAGLGADNVVVFSGDELMRRGYRTLGEALSFEAGFVRERAGGGQHYSLYGVNSGAALIVDGVPLVVDGERDVLDVDDVLDLAEVERVEIVKGPSTAFSGAGALTGAVRVTTRRPGVSGASVRVSGSALTSTSTANDPSVPIAGERSMGASATVRDDDLAARASLRLSSGAEQLWRLRAVPLRFERVGGVALPVTKGNVDVVTGDDTTLNLRGALLWGETLVDLAWAHDLQQQPISDFSHGLIDTPQQQTRDVGRARALWQRQLGGAHVEVAVTGAHHERGVRIPLFPRLGLFDDGGLLAVDSAADTGSALGRVDVGIHEGHHLLAAVFGDLTHATARSSSTDPVSGEQSDDLVTFDDVSGSANAAVEYQGDFGAGLHLTAGLVAFWRTSFRPGLSPRLALSWSTQSLHLDANYSEGVRAPDRFDVTALAKAVVDGRVVGAADNSALRPELVRTLQFGAGFAPSSALSVSARLFGLRHEDAVSATQDGALLRPANLPPRLLLGAEVGADVAPFDDLVHLRGALVGLARVDQSNINTELLQTVFDASLTPVDNLSLGTRARAALRTPKESAVIDVYISTSVGSDVKEDLVVVFVLRNALDALELAIDDDAPPFADPVLYPGPGRSLTLAVEGRF